MLRISMLAISLLVSPALAFGASGDVRSKALYAKVEKKKKAKKKKKEDDDEAFGPDELGAAENNDNGAGIHRDQMGVDHPYGNEISGSTSFKSLSTKAGDADTQTETLVDIGGEFLFILGHVEIGPALEYHMDSSKAGTVTTDSSSYAVGPVIKVNFGNIDHNIVVPFALLGAEYRAGSTKAGDTKEVTNTGTIFRVGGGVNLFMNNSVTFQPKLEYRQETAKGDGAGAVTTTTSGIQAFFGIGVFL